MPLHSCFDERFSSILNGFIPLLVCSRRVEPDTTKGLYSEYIMYSGVAGAVPFLDTSCFLPQMPTVSLSFGICFSNSESENRKAAESGSFMLYTAGSEALYEKSKNIQIIGSSPINSHLTHLLVTVALTI